MSHITITAATLKKLFQLNCYVIPDDVNLLFVGIRAALPLDAEDQTFKAGVTLDTGKVDYKTLNCTVLQWQLAEETVAAFPASTVPCYDNIIGYRAVPRRNSNCLSPGFYKYYHKGKHRPAKTANWHDAFRQDGQQLTIRRTYDNTYYDNFDTIEVSTGCDDNIHAAWTLSLEGAYSSAGCQVIMGIPYCEHTKSYQNDNRGPWKTFKANAYATNQVNFPYALFTSTEVSSIIAKAGGSMTTRLKFGSSGDAVKAIQQSLIDKNYLSGSADGDFGKNTFNAVKKFQTENFGQEFTDCVVGPVTAGAMGVVMPTVQV